MNFLRGHECRSLLVRGAALSPWFLPMPRDVAAACRPLGRRCEGALWIDGSPIFRTSIPQTSIWAKVQWETCLSTAFLRLNNPERCSSLQTQQFWF